MKYIKNFLMIMMISLLAACGASSSNEKLEQEIKKEEHEPVEEEDRSVENSEVSEEELIATIKQLEQVNMIIHGEGIMNDRPYSEIAPQLTPYMTDHWIQSTESIYEQSYIDNHVGFFPFQVEKNIDYWFDYQIDGATAYVSTFSLGNDFAYNSYDVDFVLKYDEGIWKVDDFELSFEYGDEGKGFTVEEIIDYVKFIRDVDLAHLETLQEKFETYEGTERIETIYKFEVVDAKEDEMSSIYISAYDGRDLMWFD